jgi:hypothetical protein
MALDTKRTYKPIRKLQKSIRRLCKEISPPEVYDFRTRARRTQAVLEALGLDRRSNERRMLQDLCKLRKRAGVCPGSFSSTLLQNSGTTRKAYRVHFADSGVS